MRNIEVDFIEGIESKKKGKKGKKGGLLRKSTTIKDKEEETKTVLP